MLHWQMTKMMRRSEKNKQTNENGRREKERERIVSSFSLLF